MGRLLEDLVRTANVQPALERLDLGPHPDL